MKHWSYFRKSIIYSFLRFDRMLFLLDYFSWIIKLVPIRRSTSVNSLRKQATLKTETQLRPEMLLINGLVWFKVHVLVSATGHVISSSYQIQLFWFFNISCELQKKEGGNNRWAPV